jgi:RHS repeat-associated protein
VGNYNYYATKPHQLNEVKSASGAHLYKFFYDANGNSKTDGTRTFTYGSYDKPTLITKAGSSSTMKYGPERELIFKTDTYVENGKNVTYQTTYLGNYEKVYRTGGAGPLTEHKFYVGDIVYTQRSNGSSDTFYLHKDHQGSVIATTNGSGAVVSQAIYDPWGKRTAVYLASLLSNYTYSEPTDRGYTGHKHIKDLDIIHMGGRIYDPTLGRFLQADPFVQAPTDSQSYNRYAYVRNNPMSMTDPSGYFFKKLLRSIAKVPILNMAVHVVLNLIPGCQGWCSAVYAAASAYAVTGSLKAAFTSGIVSAITPGAEGFLAAGVIGGLASKAQGGNFGHGFWSAGLGAAVGGRIKTGNAYANVIVSAVIGGSVSKVTGGKFANGAQTWAFSAALRAAMNGEFEAKGREATNQQELTKDQIAVSKANFLKAKSAVLKDYTNGYFGSAVDGEVMHVDAADVSFEEGRLYHEGKEVWGLTTPKNHRSSWSASIEISAAACLDSANCYQTLGHEFAHTNMYSYFNLKNGHSEMALMAQGMGSPERFMMAISAGRKTYLEDFAEYTGVTWAKSKGY